MKNVARFLGLFLAVTLTALMFPFSHASLAQQGQPITKSNRRIVEEPRYKGAPSRPEEAYIIREVDGQASCEEVNPAESELFLRQDPNIRLHQINHVGEITAQETGLTIILNATAQLQANAVAKQAFTTAAARWEALIQNPVTVVIDVDFGTSFFGGAPFASNVLGGAQAQLFGDPSDYPDVRSRLISGAASADETTLYNALPTSTVLTDRGPTAQVLTSSAVFRALGALPAVANPATEPGLSIPPRIAFNSAFAFDFDPTNGIDSDKTDFDAVATHEIGHVLGFTSRVGASGSPVVSILDVFRFRPGMSIGQFTNAQRILTVGGSQIFFAGGPELGLSTGDLSGSGGDNQQASHWKDDAQTGSYIGIMDPTIPRGRRQTITSNDLLAYDTFGWRLMGSAPPPGDDAVALTSGASQMGSIAAPPGPDLGRLGSTQYSIQVPAGTTQLKIDLAGNQDVDLYARFGAKIAISDSGDLLADHRSESFTGTESIIITPASSPQLRQGTYFIAVGNFGPGAADYTLTATVTTGGGGGGGTPPSVSSFTASLNGDTVTLNGSVSDPDGDMVSLQSSLLNEAGQVLATTQVLPYAFGTATTASFSVDIDGANDFPSAVKAAIVINDSQGNHSTSATADFSQADPGGPTIKNVIVSGSKVTIKGKDIIGFLTLEINGVDVATKDNSGVKKAKFGGAASALKSGDNRIRIRNGVLRSNIFILTQ